MREATLREKFFHEGMEAITEAVETDPTYDLAVMVGTLSLTVGEILVRANLTTKEEFDGLCERNMQLVKEFYKEGMTEELNRRLDQVEREVTDETSG